VNKDRAVLTVSDVNNDLFAKRLVMTSVPAFTWTDAAASAALETNLSSTTVGGHSFVFWPAPPTTVFEQSAYRFFANTATTDVGPPLALTHEDTFTVVVRIPRDAPAHPTLSVVSNTRSPLRRILLGEVSLTAEG